MTTALRPPPSRWRLLWFFDPQYLIRFHAFEDLGYTARPEYADLLNMTQISQTEMHSVVTRRCVTDARGHMVVLISDLDTHSDTVSVTLGAL